MSQLRTSHTSRKEIQKGAILHVCAALVDPRDDDDDNDRCPPVPWCRKKRWSKEVEMEMEVEMEICKRGEQPESQLSPEYDIWCCVRYNSYIVVH